jgi:concentrative nucleoside transporter, CNT family
MNYRNLTRIVFLLAALLFPIVIHAQTTQAAAPNPIVPHGTPAQRLQSAFGLFSFTILAFVIGKLRGSKKIPWRVIIWGTILDFVFGALVIFAPGVLVTVQLIVQKLLDFSNAGAQLVFGNLIANPVNVTGDALGNGPITGYAQIGFVFAFSVLPTIIFIAMLTAVLYHLGILTWVVHGLAWIMRKSMGTSGAETLSTAANIFVGQTEAPLIVKPFLAAATNSEMMAIMVGGFANIASGVLVVYSELLKDFVPNAGGHLALACFISAPATLVVSKLMMPETGEPITAGGVDFTVERLDANLIDAATRGTTEGMALCINVAAMLIAFTALVALLNAIFGSVTGWMHLGPMVMIDGHATYSGIKLEQALGYLMAPIMWLCGVDWASAIHAGSLLGIKTVLNEFLAYFEMSNQLHANPNYLSPRAALLSTYALCGFANFASVGIQIGGISTMAPTRRADLSRLGLLAMVGGAIASCMGACVVGVLW